MRRTVGVSPRVGAGRCSHPRRDGLFVLVSRRYERASLIVTSIEPFSAWGEIFGDEVAATAMIDRLVHRAEILSLRGDSYRLKDRDLDRPPAARPPGTACPDPSRPSRAGPQTAITRPDLSANRPPIPPGRPARR